MNRNTSDSDDRILPGQTFQPEPHRKPLIPKPSLEWKGTDYSHQRIRSDTFIVPNTVYGLKEDLQTLKPNTITLSTTALVHCSGNRIRDLESVYDVKTDNPFWHEIYWESPFPLSCPSDMYLKRSGVVDTKKGNNRSTHWNDGVTLFSIGIYFNVRFQGIQEDHLEVWTLIKTPGVTLRRYGSVRPGSTPRRVGTPSN